MLRRFAQAAEVLRASLRQHSASAAVRVGHAECGGAHSQLQVPSLAQLLASAAALRPSELAGRLLPWRQLCSGAASCACATIRNSRLQFLQQRGYNSLPQWQILSKPKCGLDVAQALQSAGCMPRQHVVCCLQAPRRALAEGHKPRHCAVWPAWSKHCGLRALANAPSRHGAGSTIQHFLILSFSFVACTTWALIAQSVPLPDLLRSPLAILGNLHPCVTVCRVLHSTQCFPCNTCALATCGRSSRTRSAIGTACTCLATCSACTSLARSWRIRTAAGSFWRTTSLRRQPAAQPRRLGPIISSRVSALPHSEESHESLGGQ